LHQTRCAAQNNGRRIDRDDPFLPTRWPTRNYRKVDKGEPVDPGTYYFRMTPIFETAAPQYDWINRIVAIGAAHRPPGPLNYIFEVL
jgi:hypothetical protein